MQTKKNESKSDENDGSLKKGDTVRVEGVVKNVGADGQVNIEVTDEAPETKEGEKKVAPKTHSFSVDVKHVRKVGE